MRPASAVRGPDFKCNWTCFNMAPKTYPAANDGYLPRKGLEGPFTFSNGRTLYYDTKEGQYWDPRSDYYVDNDEMNRIHMHMVERLKA